MAGNTTRRGYGTHHQRERTHWARELKRAGHLPCARCGQSIRHGDAWDLGHTDDRTGYQGPEHPDCNRSAGGAAGRAIQLAKAEPQPQPRTDWFTHSDSDLQ